MVRTRSMTAVLRSWNLNKTKAAPTKRKGAQLKRKAVISSEEMKRMAANAVDVDKILRLKKEALEAMQAKCLLLTAAGETQPSGAEEERVLKKKATKVVKYLVSQAYIDYLEAGGLFQGVDKIPEDKLAKESQLLHDDCRAKLLLSEKLRACQQVLLDQYDAFGYAYDAKEVTDDEGDGVLLLKN